MQIWTYLRKSRRTEIPEGFRLCAQYFLLYIGYPKTFLVITDQIPTWRRFVFQEIYGMAILFFCTDWGAMFYRWFGHKVLFF